MIIDCAWCPLPAEPGNPLCGECLAASAADIAALAGDWSDLDAALPLAGAPQQRVSGTRAPSVPIDLLADELARGIAWTLGVWEPPVREAAGLPAAPEKVRSSVLVDRASALLSGYVSDFAGLGDTLGYADGLSRGSVVRRGLYGVSSCRRLHERARLVLGAAEPLTLLPGLCGRCGAAALGHQPGGRVECRHCAHIVDLDDYRGMLSLDVTLTGE